MAPAPAAWPGSARHCARAPERWRMALPVAHGAGPGGPPCRATFGVSQKAMEQAMQDGFDRTVDRLRERTADPAGLISLSDPAQGSELALNELQRWWMHHMLSTPAPFAERMTLFWHGHFTTEYQKVAYGSPFIYWQNLTWRRLGLDQVIDQILAQPVTAPFIVRKLWRYFLSPAPAADGVRGRAGSLRTAGYDVRALMRALLKSPESVAPDSYRALVRSPVEFMVAAALALGAEPEGAAGLIADYTEPAGQALF